MALNDRNYSFDINLQLADGAAPQTAQGLALVGGAAAILDLGGNQAVSPKQQARLDAVAVVDIAAATLAAGNGYKFYVVGSNDPALASGNVVLGAVEVGNGAGWDITNGGTIAVPPATTPPSIPGRLEIFFCTQVLGALYQYIGLFVGNAGATPSVQFKAFVAVLPRT